MSNFTIMSTICTKSITQVLPSFTISILVLSGYFSLLGGLMIGLGGAMFYQGLRSSQKQTLPETFVATSTHIHTF
ncbi:MAG: hypothetical protein QNJ33_03785 [Crocosphaera sp.]|nr:hypothetical protein [Crocosphaera sp.]